MSSPPLIDDGRYIDRCIDTCQYEQVKLLEVIESCCPNGLLAAPLDWTDASRLAETLKALADPARLRILSMISASASGQVCACELTEPLGLAQPTVSHHLKVLNEAGLLDREQRGRWAYYRISPEALSRLREALPAEPALT
jgi:ArsR family transcriptional regulator